MKCSNTPGIALLAFAGIMALSFIADDDETKPTVPPENAGKVRRRFFRSTVPGAEGLAKL